MMYQLLDPRNSMSLMVVEADDIDDAWGKILSTGIKNPDNFELEAIL